MNITRLYISIIFFTAHLTCNTFTVLIIPAGTAHYAGRSVGDRFERGLTLQLAHAIQTACKQKQIPCTVLIHKSSDLQKNSAPEIAQVANRLNPDLVIALSLYLETDPKPHWYTYHYSFGDHFVQLPTTLQLVALDQAHLVHSTTTQRYANTLHTNLTQTNFFTAHTPAALPVAPLAGITAPALLCEIGIKKEDDWQTAVDPLVSFIMQACNHG